MDTTAFAFIMSLVVLCAILFCYAILAREERQVKREYWLTMKDRETRQLELLGGMFKNAKHLEIESPRDGHLKITMSRRDHAPLPPQYITPTIVAPQPLYGGGVSRVEMLTGNVRDFCDDIPPRRKVTNFSNESTKYANKRNADNERN